MTGGAGVTSGVSFKRDPRCPKLGEGETGIRLVSAEGRLWGAFRVPESGLGGTGAALDHAVLVFISDEHDVPQAMRLCANQVVFPDDETSRAGFREAVFHLDPSAFLVESGAGVAITEDGEPEAPTPVKAVDYRVIASIGRWTSEVVKATLRV